MPSSGIGTSKDEKLAILWIVGLLLTLLRPSWQVATTWKLLPHFLPWGRCFAPARRHPKQDSL
uniref:Uncharacterized protein n=1 Tax=Candidatus Kentrum sp. LPFa TaxID=2126335 RepID=A0A450WQ46_9GAMM|nr:MAG: hypothetical protein BECKLPF1236B_GA0070989_11638 [Candidatus Kentron sp. LPFa]